MEKSIVLLAGLLLSFSAVAQTKVVKANAVKANDYGVAYSLPKTELVVDAEVTKVTCKAGPYYQYAEKYLGVKKVITDDEVPDKNNTYMVSFKPGTVAPYAYLTEEGLLCSINAEYTPDSTKEADNAAKKAKKAVATDASVFSEELLMAGSTAKQAEVAAKQIYRIRESRMNILQLVIEELEAQEQALTNLFVGVMTRTTEHYEVTVEPTGDLEKEILFRFSEHLGVVDADDLGGQPVYMNLKAIERAPQLDPKEAEKKEKSLKGIVYNVPGASLCIKAKLRLLSSVHRKHWLR